MLPPLGWAQLVTVLALEAVLAGAWLAWVWFRKSSFSKRAAPVDFKALIAEVSDSLSGIPLEQVNAALDAALRRVAEVAGADFASLSFTGVGVWGLPRVSEHRTPLSPGGFPSDSSRFPWIAATNSAVVFTNPATLPAKAEKDQASLADLGIHSAVIIPVSLKHGTGCMFTLGVSRPREWAEDCVTGAHALAQVLGATVARQEAEFAMQASESLNQAVMSSLSGYVVIADQAGVVLGANEGHLTIGQAWRPVPFPPVPRGESYLDAWLTGCYSASDESQRLVRAVRSVLSGVRAAASVECRFRSDYGDHWLEVHAERLDRPEGGAVITHLDITRRKRTELEASRNLGEISHLNRVAAMGEMAASLAHELNQPLAAIVANGEAAEWLLQSPAPDLKELKSALADIVEDGRRAGEVIRNMRALLRKGNPQRATVDLNAITADSVRLVRNSALLARVRMSQISAPELPPVLADAVQIQQVILNLVANAIDAVSTVPEASRLVALRTSVEHEPPGVQLEVSDSGPGIDESRRSAVFQPFFTTKDQGLGVGLSVSRSIIEAHGGRIWAENNPNGGAILRFFLPAA